MHAVIFALLTALPTNSPECVRLYRTACSEALGKWLPTFALANDFWSRNSATHITRSDGFSYEGQRAPTPGAEGLEGAKDGTFFVYGNAGPPKGQVVYDYAHHVAFYDQGCCSWHDSVAAYAPPPPKRVVNRDLTQLHTVRGVRLGMSPEQVQRIYGKATLRNVRGYNGVDVLPYTTFPPRDQANAIYTPCGQFENFFFQNDRLVLIQIGNWC
jgi:hypothetical protein